MIWDQQSIPSILAGNTVDWEWLVNKQNCCKRPLRTGLSAPIHFKRATANGEAPTLTSSITLTKVATLSLIHSLSDSLTDFHVYRAILTLRYHPKLIISLIRRQLECSSCINIFALKHHMVLHFGKYTHTLFYARERCPCMEDVEMKQFSKVKGWCVFTFLYLLFVFFVSGSPSISLFLSVSLQVSGTWVWTVNTEGTTATIRTSMASAISTVYHSPCSMTVCLDRGVKSWQTSSTHYKIWPCCLELDFLHW